MAGVSLISLMCNDTKENRACGQGKIIFIGIGKTTGGAQGWNMFHPTPASEDLWQGSHPRLRKDDS